jgi:hypothetical protein
MDTASDLDIFYFAFGMLRQAIWSVSPQMKREMLKERRKSADERPNEPQLE